tara:strand:+ start:749 stop:1066 length:318 start_codon:yes stop_codon:yes gene_type:complete
MNKYKNIKTIVDGIKFDSKKEANRYCDLLHLERCGYITQLRLQPDFPLMVNGKKIGKYVADFSYIQNGVKIIEDVKSKATMTPVYRMKKKILSTYDPPIKITEYF